MALQAPRRNALITLDAFGTLIKPKMSIGTTYAAAAKKYGIDLTATESAVLKSFTKAYNLTNGRYPNFGRNAEKKVKYEAWWHQVIKGTFEPLTTQKIPRELYNELFHHFSTAEGYELYPDVVPFLERITSTTNPPDWDFAPAISMRHPTSHSHIPSPITLLGVISNCDPRLPDVLEGLGILRYFSFLTMSYDLGIMKPSRQMFREARKSALELVHPGINLTDDDGVEQPVWRDIKGEYAWEFIHIGDNLFKDYIPTFKVKDFNGVWLDRAGNGIYPGDKPKFQKFSTIATVKPKTCKGGSWRAARKKYKQMKAKAREMRAQGELPSLDTILSINSLEEVFAQFKWEPEPEEEEEEEEEDEDAAVVGKGNIIWKNPSATSNVPPLPGRKVKPAPPVHGRMNIDRKMQEYYRLTGGRPSRY